MKIKSLCITVLTAVVILVLPVSGIFAATDDDKLINHANKLYRDKQYDEALEIYDELLKKDSDSDILNYNTGFLHYVKGDYSTAVRFFTKALVTDSFPVEKDALSFIGNSYYRMSEQKEAGDRKESIAFCRKAVDYYRRSIELDDRDRDIKYNFEMAESRLIALLKKDEEPDQSQSSGSGEGEGDGSGGGGGGGEGGGEGEPGEGAPGEGEPGEGEPGEGEGAPGEEGAGGTEGMSESQGRVVIDAYWNGEAPKMVLESERSLFKDEVSKDW